MHDRRIDGKARIFGNYGSLYMNAMTWYDHETVSLWSQPIGTALRGAYEGVRLEMIPAPVVPWATWRKEHPDTLVLNVGLGRFGTLIADPFAGDRRLFIAGVVLGDHAKAYPFDVVSQQVVVNDQIGETPVLVYANPEDKSVHIFARKVGDTVLEFRWAGGKLRDIQTDTLWNQATGLGIEGPLRGELLKELPYSSAYAWAWVDFYPDTEVYRP